MHLFSKLILPTLTLLTLTTAAPAQLDLVETEAASTCTDNTQCTADSTTGALCQFASANATEGVCMQLADGDTVSTAKCQKDGKYCLIDRHCCSDNCDKIFATDVGTCRPRRR
ncbi:uncharacterized protein DSM5745_05545 [Aspergillus mulundensis]|uniref:Uncharacterized protein n=1 Tax=Aspergillus mulundensis TaxID=1810919 RepID=A0A3D8RXC3_9EURO|nr:hypothetical protein DSM5745_05545 [Aspergillus mulundensis]RDW78693.1 hypothetical protein DSM5745_05545 [Aspergillus mulundensis]